MARGSIARNGAAAFDAVAEALNVVRSRAADIDLDWTREPLDDVERSVRAKILERVERSATTPANRLHGLAALMRPYGPFAVPASDVREAIERNAEAQRAAELPAAIERDLQNRRLVQDALRELAGEAVQPLYNAAESFERAMRDIRDARRGLQSAAEDAERACREQSDDGTPMTHMHRAATSLGAAMECGQHLRARLEARGLLPDAG